MHGLPGVDLQGLLAGSQCSDHLARAQGVGSPLFSSAVHVCPDIHVTRQFKIAILSLGLSKANPILDELVSRCITCNLCKLTGFFNEYLYSLNRVAFYIIAHKIQLTYLS